MRTFGVDFLSIVSDDDGNSDSVSSSPLSSVSQNSVSHNAVSRVCGLVCRGLSKISFIGSAFLLSSLLSIVESASAQSNNAQNWEALKARACTLLFLESSVNKTVEESFHRVDVRSELRSILGEDKLSRDSISDNQLGVMLVRLRNSYKRMLSDFMGKVYNAHKAGLNIPSKSYRDVYMFDSNGVADTSVCPDLYEFVNGTPTASTSLPTTVPMITTTDFTSTDTFSPASSTKDVVLIFAAALFMFASIFLLVRNKYPSLKNMSVARCKRAILGRKERKEIEELAGSELEEVVLCHSMFSQAVYKRSTGKRKEQLYYVI